MRVKSVLSRHKSFDKEVNTALAQLERAKNRILEVQTHNVSNNSCFLAVIIYEEPRAETYRDPQETG